MSACAHSCMLDVENPLFEECSLCQAVRRIREYCPDCGGKKWNNAVRYDDEGYAHKYRAPCGTCDASGMIRLEVPKLLQSSDSISKEDIHARAILWYALRIIKKVQMFERSLFDGFAAYFRQPQYVDIA